MSYVYIMRWVIASLLAGMVTVVLFFGMIRFVNSEHNHDSIAKGYTSVVFGQSETARIGNRIICIRPPEHYESHLSLKPIVSMRDAILYEAQAALLNSSWRVDFERVSFDLPSLPQSRPKKIEKVSACIVHHSPCDGHPTPEVHYPRSGTTARLPDTLCDVSYSIGADGVPRDIEVSCGHPAFEVVSREAISQMRYATEDRCGPCERSDLRVTYPLEFLHE